MSGMTWFYLILVPINIALYLIAGSVLSLVVAVAMFGMALIQNHVDSK